MSSKLTATGLIGLGCIAAAAAGGYLALRSNAADRPVAVTAQGSEATTPAAAPPEPTPALPPTAEPQRPIVPAPAPKAPVATQKSPAMNTELAPAPTAAPMPPAPIESLPLTQTAPAMTPTMSAPAVPVPQVPAAPAVPAKYDEVTVTANSVLGLRLDSTISSETARVEDRVNARLSRDLLVDGRVAFPSGSRLEGVVSLVERGGKFKERPRIGIMFNTLVLADGTRVAIQTDAVYRDGDSPSGQANAKVGGSAVVGAIIGAMIGGKKGAILGGSAGAAGGAAAVAAGDRADLVISAGTNLTVRLSAPVTVLIERNHEG